MADADTFWGLLLRVPCVSPTSPCFWGSHCHGPKIHQSPERVGKPQWRTAQPKTKCSVVDWTPQGPEVSSSPADGKNWTGKVIRGSKTDQRTPDPKVVGNGATRSVGLSPVYGNSLDLEWLGTKVHHLGLFFVVDPQNGGCPFGFPLNSKPT